jgi:hypothetical protein
MPRAESHGCRPCDCRAAVSRQAGGPRLMARADETPAPVNQKMSPSSNNRFGAGTTPMRVPSPNGTRREEAPPRGKRLVVPEVVPRGRHPVFMAARRRPSRAKRRRSGTSIAVSTRAGLASAICWAEGLGCALTGGTLGRPWGGSWAKIKRSGGQFQSLVLALERCRSVLSIGTERCTAFRNRRVHDRVGTSAAQAESRSDGAG